MVLLFKVFLYEKELVLLSWFYSRAIVVQSVGDRPFRSTDILYVTANSFKEVNSIHACAIHTSIHACTRWCIKFILASVLPKWWWSAVGITTDKKQQRYKKDPTALRVSSFHLNRRIIACWKTCCSYWQTSSLAFLRQFQHCKPRVEFIEWKLPHYFSRILYSFLVPQQTMVSVMS